MILEKEKGIKFTEKIEQEIALLGSKRTYPFYVVGITAEVAKKYKQKIRVIADNKYFANGGRLFYIVGEGKNVIAAREKAYKAMEKISIEGDNLHYRTDIGYRDVKRLQRK